jgi:hypothetical protein
MTAANSPRPGSRATAATAPLLSQPENFLFREPGRHHIKAIDFGLSAFFQVWR